MESENRSHSACTHGDLFYEIASRDLYAMIPLLFSETFRITSLFVCDFPIGGGISVSCAEEMNKDDLNRLRLDDLMFILLRIKSALALI